MDEIIIIGAGAAGISAALELAENGVKSILVSDMPSERTQSVMAEGGINAAFSSNQDSPALHARETLEIGRFLADSSAVLGLAENAPKIINELFDGGMSFTLNDENKPDVRAFGGQSVKRTFYAAADTGRQLMHTLIGRGRCYEEEGFIRRMTGWLFLRLLRKEDRVCGCVLAHSYTGEQISLFGKIIVASGGLNGMFGNATGSVGNTGAVTASLFAEGAAIANGEFIQFHPTTVRLHGKNMLITEAVRGEGGRLLTLYGGKPFYFMEEKYPKLGNLMPRDVIAREEWLLMQQGQQIFLDMRGLDEKVQNIRLRGVIDACLQFLSLDPTKELIPVVPGIHYFMGGIRVDRWHRTDFKGLYAAGECACQYHGANRLGGNSLLGAIYGGKIAARSAVSDSFEISCSPDLAEEEPAAKMQSGLYAESMIVLRGIMQNGLGIVRNEETIKSALKELVDLRDKIRGCCDPSASFFENNMLKNCCLLGQALLMSADARKESRGAHTRSDFPAERPEYQKQTAARLEGGQIEITFESAGEENAD